MARRPRIGLTVNYEEKVPGRAGLFIGADYTDAIYHTGGLPWVLPLCAEPDVLDAFAEAIDGLLLTGGGDIGPALFGEEPRIGLGEITPLRDEMEVALFARVLALGKPILGICRGIQVMNAALGGTLYQDLSREWKGSMQHIQKAPRDYLAHTVDVLLGTRLHAICMGQTAAPDPQHLQTNKLAVNTFHHQAIKCVATGCVVSARSPDGLIEAIEDPRYPFVIGVQWHPENLWRRDEPQRRLFTAFVDAARDGCQSVQYT